MTRFVGLDLGARRIGVAVSDTGRRARPLATIARAPTAAEDVLALRHVLGDEPDEIVVGLPLDMAGGEGPQAAATRAWIREAEAVLGIPVHVRDERLSSHLAEARLGPMKRGRSGGPPTPTQRRAHRARVDREAAAIILQDHLDARTTPVKG